MTALDLGKVSWDRNDGIFYLRIVVTAKGMSGQTEFKVSLEPPRSVPNNGMQPTPQSGAADAGR